MRLSTIILLLVLIHFSFSIQAQQQLEVEGKIKISDDINQPEEGNIRYNNTNKDFEGFDGFQWLSLTRSNGNLNVTCAEIVQEIDVNYYGAYGLDMFFEQGKQLIVYGAYEGLDRTQDSIVVYDYKAQEIINVRNAPFIGFRSNSIKFTFDGNGYYFLSEGLLKYVDDFQGSSTTVSGLTDIQSFNISRDYSSLTVMHRNNGIHTLSRYDIDLSTNALTFQNSIVVNAIYYFGDVGLSEDGNVVAVSSGTNNENVLIHNWVLNSTLVSNTGNSTGTYTPCFINEYNSMSIIVGGGYPDAGDGGEITIIDAETGAITSSTNPFTWYNYYNERSKNGTLLLSGGYDGDLKLFDWETMSEIQTIDLNEIVNNICISKNADYAVVSTKFDGKVFILKLMGD